MIWRSLITKCFICEGKNFQFYKQIKYTMQNYRYTTNKHPRSVCMYISCLCVSWRWNVWLPVIRLPTLSLTTAVQSKHISNWITVRLLVKLLSFETSYASNHNDYLLNILAWIYYWSLDFTSSLFLLLSVQRYCHFEIWYGCNGKNMCLWIRERLDQAFW